VRKGVLTGVAIITLPWGEKDFTLRKVLMRLSKPERPSIEKEKVISE
jgi:hypothetical protein